MQRTCSKAVILAAGSGTRVQSLASARPKSLMDLGGKPIIGWILQALAEGGIREVVMVTGFGASALRKVLGTGRRYGLRIRYIHNRRWTEPNGLSLYAARRSFRKDETFLTVMSDHLLPPKIIAKVARARTPRCVLAVDTDIRRVFDISDATKVRIEDGEATAIGKKLWTYNAVDCGLFRFDGRVFPALAEAFEEGLMSLTGGVKNLIRDGDLDVMPMSDVFWLDIDTPRAYRQAIHKIDKFKRFFRKDKAKHGKRK